MGGSSSAKADTIDQDKERRPDMDYFADLDILMDESDLRNSGTPAPHGAPPLVAACGLTTP
jgi:hypothetical protein